MVHLKFRVRRLEDNNTKLVRLEGVMMGRNRSDTEFNRGFGDDEIIIFFFPDGFLLAAMEAVIFSLSSFCPV